VFAVLLLTVPPPGPSHS